MTEPQFHQCWLCLRTTPQRILEGCRQIYNLKGSGKDVAHKIGIKAAELLRDAYLKEPTKVSGRNTKALMAAAIYIVSIIENEHITQREAAQVFDITEPAIRDNYRVLWRILKGDSLHRFHKKQVFALKKRTEIRRQKREKKRIERKPPSKPFVPTIKFLLPRRPQLTKNKKQPNVKNPWENVPGVISTARGIHKVEGRRP